MDETVEPAPPDEVGAAPAEAVLPRWMTALEARHLADLRVPEITRALRALSSAYVERRHGASTAADGRQKVRGTLDSAGKRAAFAVFYAPLHFIAVARAVVALGAHLPGPTSIVDLGCGTGAAGAAWSLSSASQPPVLGIDRHPWAADEARWTYARLGVRGRTRVSDVARLTDVRAGTGIVAAYILNELADSARLRVEAALYAAAERGARVLIVEPIARTITPWWDTTATRIVAMGGRADEWRWPIDLPPLVRLLDKSAGLDHRVMAIRTLFV